MAFQIRGGETKEVVLEEDPDQVNPTVWILGTLDLRTRAFIQDEMTAFQVSDSKKAQDKSDVKLRISQGKILTAQFGVRGWRNLKDEHGQDIPYKTDTFNLDGKSYEVVAKIILERFPYEWVELLSEEVSKLNTITEPERKN